MQAFVVVLLASCVGLGAAIPNFRPSAHFFQSDPPAGFYKPAEPVEAAVEPHVAAFASIFQIDEIVPLKEIPVEEVAKPMSIAIQPVLSSFHDEPSIFEVEHTDKLPQLEVLSELEFEHEDTENIIVVEKENEAEDNEHIPSPSDIPGLSYADTPAKLEALGVDLRFVDQDILEDSFLLVVSCGRSLAARTG